ncbi:hypothetical protein BS17DRAFT_841153 [Gyrodon lividus]|nr:hypothetical protein BS17DRAFT_721306 [Gyrodon lividus]KAF9228930.1 hypothetical protein BS17DRAFT_841153 [Gyrodon lividus]
MSNNDVMIQELTVLAGRFAGLAAHTCCFLHIINLVAKRLLCQFDVKKNEHTINPADSDDETWHELEELDDLLIEDDEDALSHPETFPTHPTQFQPLMIKS